MVELKYVIYFNRRMEVDVMRKKSIAIITARGGSKRIPKKNIRDFCGKPILVYSIEAAKQCEIFDEIMVSTDDDEIAEIAIKYGAKVPFRRSKKTADDFATTAEVLLEVLNQYAEVGEFFDYMTCIYPTAPFVTAEKIRRGMELVEENDAILALPVIPFSYPPQRSYILESGKLKMKWVENLNKRSQDLETFYHDCGQFYCYDVSKFIEANGQVKDNIIPVLLDEKEVQDIDNESDWEMAEIKYRLMRNEC